eukprot:TRINITY_DN698_c0_g3_i2.p1 TRINITY_DN698_c0_g3~~TRINITY_DN698_c0_g3_i2.p1  ORF type:complete len:655 (+),score=99.61 TRINITY_DN698_c0_g3_i2:373-2337(+)
MRGDNQGLPFPETYVTLASNTLQLVKLLVKIGGDDVPKPYRSALEKCEFNCRSRIGRIEVIDSNDQLKMVHFPIPSDFRRAHNNVVDQWKIQLWDLLPSDLSDYWVQKYRKRLEADPHKQQEERLNTKLQSRLILNQNADQFNKAGVKIDAFMDWGEEILRKREIKNLIRENPNTYLRGFGWAFYNLGRHFNTLWYISYLLVIVLNILVLHSERRRDIEKRDQTAIKTLGSVLCFLSILILISWLQRNGRYNNRRAWIHSMGDKESYLLYSWRELRETELKSSLPFYWAVSVGYISLNLELIFYFVYACFAFLGTCSSSPLWFAYHLFAIIPKSSHLKVIMQSIVENIVPLALTVLTAIEAIYILSCISYSFFQERYVPTEEAYGMSTPCMSLVQCFFTNLHFGLSSGGQLYQFVTPSVLVDPWTDELTSETIAWTIYSVIFFFVIAVIIMNVIFAIIVDTFGRHRDIQEEAARGLDSRCFICSLERDIFLQSAKDFNFHTESEHNKLHYLYYFAYLQDKIDTINAAKRDKTNYKPLTALENYIQEKVRTKKYLKFFPYNRAGCLEQEEEEVGYGRKILQKKFQKLEKDFDNSIEKQEKNAKTIITCNAQLTLLIESLAALRSYMNKIRLTSSIHPSVGLSTKPNSGISLNLDS